MEPTDLTEDETTLLLFLDANSAERLPVHEVVARANIDEHVSSLPIDTLCRNDLIHRDKRGRLIIKVPGQRMAIRIREAEAADLKNSSAQSAKLRREWILGIIAAIGVIVAIVVAIRGC